MAQKKQTIDWRFFPLLILPLIWAVVGHQGYLRFIDDLLLSLRYQARGEIDAPVPVIYVDVDTQSITELGNFPWPRNYFAEVGRALMEEGRARAIGVDILFSEKGTSEAYDRNRWVQGNVAFARFLQAKPPVIVAASYAASEHRLASGQRVQASFPLLRDELPPIEEILEPELPEFSIGRGLTWNPPRIGLIDTIEGGTQWVPLFAPTGIKRYEHMALGLALLYWGVDPESLVVTDRYIDVPNPQGGLPLRRIPLVDQQLLEINWFSHWESPNNPRIAFSTVYNYVRALASDNPEHQAVAKEFFQQFNNAVVLIGPVDKLLQDLATTPFDEVPVPKVGVHGNLVKTIVSGEFLQRLPIWGLYALTIGLSVMVTLLAQMGGAKGLRSKLTALLVLVAYVWLSFSLFESSHIVLPMGAPLGGALTMAFCGVIWQLVIEEKQKGRIKNLFGTYLSPQLVNQMVDSETDPQLGGHEDIITAYFSDIQSFSTFSELMPPSQLVELMNEYLTVCTDIIQEEGGTLDKYIGDAVVAMFGAPLPLKDHAYRACVSTLRVQKEIDRLRDKWKGETGKWPEVVHNLRARLGLNTGSAIIGNMGSRSRFSYTMMGDNVNLAARMESGAKSLGVYIMVTESTKLECEKHGGDRIVFRYLDRIVVKGRSQPVPVFEVVGFREDLPQKMHDCLETYAKGIERYLAQDWDGATKLFEQSARLEPNQPHSRGIESNPSHILIKRCAAMKAHPPGPNWDGVYVMKEK